MNNRNIAIYIRYINSYLSTFRKGFAVLLLACLMPYLAVAQLQKVSVNFVMTPLDLVIKQLEAQSKVYFLYNSTLINPKMRVSVNKKNAALSEVLQEMFKGTGISYKFEDNQIILSKSIAQDANAQKSGATATTTPRGSQPVGNTANRDDVPQRGVIVRGTVKDTEGQPLFGAAIVVKGNSRKVTTTDLQGRYVLAEVDPNAVLVFSFVGYGTIEQSVNNQAIVDLTFKGGALQLEEVVVTGYASIAKERATGAFNIVRSDVIEKSHSSNLSTALLGTVAGMQGKENADGTIDYTIRGVSSLYANSSPLVVVDGFPVANGFKDVNPNDVQSVTVLKDAAAASIWGARSANGVIVVTTKTGSAAKAGGLVIEANAMVRIGEKLDLSTVLTTASSRDQVYYESLAFENNWILQEYVNTFTNLKSSLSLASEYIYAYRNKQISKSEMDAGLARLSGINNRGQIKDHLLQNPILQQYNLAVSNTTDRMKNYMSVMYENQAGNVIANSNSRWRINYNNQTRLFKWLDFSFGTNIHFITSQIGGPTLSEISSLSPYEMILNEDGTYATQLGKNREQLAKIPAGRLPYEDWDYNLLREVRGRDFLTEELNTRVQAALVFKIAEGLTFDTKFQYEYNKSERDKVYGADTYYVRDMVNTYLDFNPTTYAVNAQFIPKGAVRQSTKINAENYVWRNQLNYSRTINKKHAITVLAGAEISEYIDNSRNLPYVYGYDPGSNATSPLPFGDYSYNKNGQKVQIKNITGDNIAFLPKEADQQTYTTAASSVTTTTNYYRNDRYVSAYANAGYTFDGKYSLSGSARSDASNLITNDPKYRWAPLWSVGGLWNVHKEGFMQETSIWLDRLAVRLTYGYNGNVEKSTSPFPLLSTGATPAAVSGFYAASIGSYGNPALRWEKTRTVNFGVDFTFFKNFLFGSVDLYNKQGKDIIGIIAIPAAQGTTSQKMNNAAISNKGIEVEIGVNTRINKDFGFMSKLTYAYNNNEVTKLYYPAAYAYEMISQDNSTMKFVEGYPAQSIWAYNYLGMKDGVPYVEGPNNTQISFNDVTLHNRGLGQQFLQYMGPATDPHSLGWYGTLNGYGFNLSFLITGKFGGHFRNPTFNYNAMSTGKNIIPMFISEVINGSDKLPSWPLLNATSTYLWDRYTPNLNTMVESSSFIKLKEITLEYALPQKWVETIGLGGIKLYGQVRDLGCLWTANSRGYDPEWLPGSLKPATTYAFGLNINFK